MQRRQFLSAVCGAAGYLASRTARSQDVGLPVHREDCINRDLATAAGDALTIAKHQGGHARVRYLTLYAVPPQDRLRFMAGISLACHQLSYAGVVVQPHKLTETVWRLDLNLYDPHNQGWEAGWEQIVAHDHRYHYGDVRPLTSTDAKVFIGSIVKVKCSDGVFRDARVSSVFEGGYQYDLFGKTYSKTIAEPTPEVRYQHLGGYGDWVDVSTASLLEEITGSKGAILDGREFAAYASTTPIYYTFRNTPKTFEEWANSFGEFGVTGFGKPGVRGANLDTSGVTWTVRGIERRRLPVWVSYDQSKAFDLTDEFDPFVLPDRTNKIRASETFAFTNNGGMDCAAWNGDWQRVDAVPGAVAIDTSFGPARELRPGRSCWSCHSKKNGGAETAGLLNFTDMQSQQPAVTKDPVLAANLAAYYGNQQQLLDDMNRDRASFLRGCLQSTEGIPPSQGFFILNELCDQVELQSVTPERACRELCLDPEGNGAVTLSRWLNGTVQPALRRLMDGGVVHWQRFKVAMPEALHAIHNRSVFQR